MLPSVSTLPGKNAVRWMAALPNHDTESITVVTWLAPFLMAAHMKWFSNLRPTQRTVNEAFCVSSSPGASKRIVSGRW